MEDEDGQRDRERGVCTQGSRSSGWRRTFTHRTSPLARTFRHTFWTAPTFYTTLSSSPTSRPAEIKVACARLERRAHQARAPALDICTALDARDVAGA